MDHYTGTAHNLDLQFNAEALPAVHERIPTPFVRTPSEPNCLRVALAGAGTRGESSMTRTLRASGHWVTVYASAGALLYQLRNHPPSLDVIVLDCGRETDAVVPSLELLRAHDDALAIVLIFDGDPNVLAEARRLSVEQVLERPASSSASPSMCLPSSSNSASAIPQTGPQPESAFARAFEDGRHPAARLRMVPQVKRPPLEPTDPPHPREHEQAIHDESRTATAPIPL